MTLPSARIPGQAKQNYEQSLLANYRAARRRIESAGQRFARQERTFEQERQAKAAAAALAELREKEAAKARLAQTTAYQVMVCDFRTAARRLFDLEENNWIEPDGRPMLRDILLMVSDKHGVSIDLIKGTRRSRYISHARFCYSWMARKRTVKSLPEIGRFINKDHTSILHGIRRFQTMIDKGQIDLSTDRWIVE